MNKPILWIGLIIISLFILTACGSSAQADINDAAEQLSEAVEGVNTELAAPDPNGDQETPQAVKFALGIFKLAETDQSLSPEQAAELLTLWKAARSLSQSETVAAEELQAVVSQIQDTMTPAQLDLLASMDLSFENMGTISEELDLDLGMAGRFGDITPEMQATMQAARESGQFPEGGFGGGQGLGRGPGGGNFGGETGLTPEQRATAMAERGGFRQAGLGIPIQLLDAIIEYLGAMAG